MSAKPNYRGLLFAKGTKGADPIVDQFLAGQFAELVAEAGEIYKDRTQRLYVESSLLATNDLTVISSFLGVSVSVLDVYRTLYWDVEGMTKLQRLAMVDSIKEASERTMKTWALTQGMKFLEWRFGNEVSISPVEGLTRIFSDCYFKSKEAFFNANASEASKESAKWTKLSVEAARLLKTWVTDTDEAMKDINIALQQFTGDDIEFPSEEDLKDD